MSEKRFERWNDHSCKVKDNQESILLSWEDVVKKLNEQQSDLVYLARFIGEFKVDEFKEKLRTLKTLEDKVDEQQTTIRSLKKENRALNSIKKFAEDNGINIFYIDTAFRNCWNDNAKLIEENEQLRKQIQNYEQLISNSMSKKQCCDCEHFGLSKDPIFRVITGTCGRCGKEVGYTDKCLFEEESFDKYLTERLNEKEEIIKEQERRIIVLENLLTNIGVKWVDDDE